MFDRPKRTVKPTKKVIENNKNKYQKKRQEQKEKITKKIEKLKASVEKQLEKEVEDYNNDVFIVRNDKDKVYEGLHYTNDDIAKNTKKLIEGFPAGFLPDLFLGLVPLFVPKKEQPINKTVYLSKLEAGNYHTSRSKSDKNIASKIKTAIKHFQHFKDLKGDDLSYLIKNDRLYFLDALEYTYKKKLSTATLKGYIDALLRLMNIAFTNPKKTPTYIKYGTLIFSLRNRLIEQDDKNELNENEETRFINWEVVLKKQKELKKQFEDIINKKTKTAYDINLDLVLLSLYCLRPPLRNEIQELEFKKDSSDKSQDYIYFKRNEVILDLNKNKKKHGAIEFQLYDELANILKQSYSLYPRKYVFTYSNKYPNFNVKASPQSIGNRLRKMFIKEGVNVGSSILRASYFSWIFSRNPNITMKEIKKIATEMRTSHTYLLTSYRKILPISAIEIPVDIKQEEHDPIDPVPPAPAPKKVEDPYLKKNDKLKKKYKDDDEYRKKILTQQAEYRASTGKKELQRRKLISELRASPAYRKSIKQSTLDKYNIVLEDIL